MSNDFSFTDAGYTPPSSYDFDFGEMVVRYYVLKGTSNNFNSVWVYGAKLYVGNSNSLTVLNIGSRTIHDWYDQTHIGRAQESLSNSDMIDVNVVG